MKDANILDLIFQSVGAATCALFILRVATIAIRFYLTSPSLNQSLRPYGAGTGSWAVVTGATDGIGLEVARLLAKGQFNVLLISRTQEKLDRVAREIESIHKVRTKTLAIDFSTIHEETTADAVQAALAGLDDISILFNNVGMSHDHSTVFNEDSLPFLRSMLNTNVLSAVTMTHLFLDHPSTTSSSHKHLILNNGSFAAIIPSPYLAVYSGTKCFLQGWSEALGKETDFERKGKVQVKHSNTYYVVSKLSKIKRPGFMVPSAYKFAYSLLTHGLSHNGGCLDLHYSTSPYHAHGWVNFVLKYVGPKALWDHLNWSVLRKLRVQWLRKVEKQKDVTAKKEE